MTGQACFAAVRRTARFCEPRRNGLPPLVAQPKLGKEEVWRWRRPMHCGRFSKPLTRRAMLCRCANGFGAVALTALLAEEGHAVPTAEPSSTRGRHHAAKARNVIFLYMDGGPSQVDTFDYKP